MRILQLVTKRQYRGAELFAANLSNELIELGHEVLFVGLYKSDKDTLEVSKACNMDLVSTKNSAFSLKIVKKLIAVVNKFKPDIIQCNGSDTLKYMVTASYFVEDVPIVYRNISIISEWVSSKTKQAFYKRMFKRIAYVTSVGDEAMADFIKTYDYPQNQTEVIRRGIPVKDIDKMLSASELRRFLNLNKTTKIAIHIGNFSPEKNHEFLIDVFEDLKREYANIKLLCIGTGVLFEKIKQRIQQKGLENNIFMMGFRKDIPELLSASDCLVLTSKVEGVPGVILEAATQKIPTVSTNVGGVREALVDGHTGFLIEDFNKKDFKNKLVQLLMNDEMRKEFGENAYKMIAKGFDPKKNTLKFEELYKNLITSHSSRVNTRRFL